MFDLAKKIRDDNTDDWLKAQWVAYLPFMAMGFIKTMDYADYKQRSLVTVDTRPTEDILAEVEAIRREINGSV